MCVCARAACVRHKYIYVNIQYDYCYDISIPQTILQGTVKGRRRQSRQRKRWEDNNREWTGLEFAKSQRAVENWGKWR